MDTPSFPRTRSGAALALVAALLSACGDRPGGEPTTTGPAAAEPEPQDLASILHALSRPHQDLRARVGPHRLSYTFEVRMAPHAPPPDPAPAGPGHPRALAVTDQVQLEWKPGALSFAHHNDADRGRWLRVVGERLYTRLPHRPWHVQDLETDAHELWLDEAARGAAEALEFVGPALALGEPVVDGDLRTFPLALRKAPDAAAPEDGPRAWRGAVTFSSVEGELVMHGPSGTLRRLDLAAQFSRPARAGEPAMSGSVRFAGRLDPADAGEIRVEPPAEATPVPERRRLEPLRREATQGLAARGAGG